MGSTIQMQDKSKESAGQRSSVYWRAMWVGGTAASTGRSDSLTLTDTPGSRVSTETACMCRARRPVAWGLAAPPSPLPPFRCGFDGVWGRVARAVQPNINLREGILFTVLCHLPFPLSIRGPNTVVFIDGSFARCSRLPSFYKQSHILVPPIPAAPTTSTRS